MLLATGNLFIKTAFSHPSGHGISIFNLIAQLTLVPTRFLYRFQQNRYKIYALELSVTLIRTRHDVENNGYLRLRNKQIFVDIGFEFRDRSLQTKSQRNPNCRV